MSFFIFVRLALLANTYTTRASLVLLLLLFFFFGFFFFSSLFLFSSTLFSIFPIRPPTRKRRVRCDTKFHKRHRIGTQCPQRPLKAIWRASYGCPCLSWEPSTWCTVLEAPQDPRCRPMVRVPPAFTQGYTKTPIPSNLSNCKCSRW